MKILLHAKLPVEASNEAVTNGSLGTTLNSILEELKPKAAYFFASKGKRSVLLILDLKDASEIPAVTEPFFLALNADCELIPVMEKEDLMKAMPTIEKDAKKYSQHR